MANFVVGGSDGFWTFAASRVINVHFHEAITLSVLEIKVPKLNPMVTPMS